MERRGLYFLMDHHRPDCNAISELWYINGYTEAQWIADLVFVANRYKDFQYFLGLDLKNEPNGAARWGSGNVAVDWNTAAEKAAAAVLAAAPRSLVIVEGVGDGSYCTSVPGGIWWGGNIAPQLCKPLAIPPEKLVLSPHVYGPDVFAQTYFSAPDFPNNMPAIWNSHFGDVQAQGYAVVIGETGGFYGTKDPRDKTFQDSLFAYLKQRDLRDVFYWSWNPNSGDTGGILNDDWTTVRQDKVNLLQSFWAGTNNPSSPSPSPPVGSPVPMPTPVAGDGGGGGGALELLMLDGLAMLTLYQVTRRIHSRCDGRTSRTAEYRVLR
jgi:endoglucanase